MSFLSGRGRRGRGTHLMFYKPNSSNDKRVRRVFLVTGLPPSPGYGLRRMVIRWSKFDLMHACLEEMLKASSFWRVAGGVAKLATRCLCKVIILDSWSDGRLYSCEPCEGSSHKPRRREVTVTAIEEEKLEDVGTQALGFGRHCRCECRWREWEAAVAFHVVADIGSLDIARALLQ